MSQRVCSGCGKAGELVRGVCRHSRYTDAKPKLGCLKKAAARDEAARAELESFWRERPRTLAEQLLLWRIRGVDTAKKGCFKPLADLAEGRTKKTEPVDPKTPKVSVRTARRAVSGLRLRREILFAGQTERGTNIYLSPGKEYDGALIPVCPHRSIAHLWPIEEAKRLIGAGYVEPTDLIVDGYRVNRRLHQEWNLSDIRAAIATIKTWYPNLSRIEHPTALLRSTLRQMLAGRNAVFASRRSDEQKAKDQARLKSVGEDLKRRESKAVDRSELEQAQATLARLLGGNSTAAASIFAGIEPTSPAVQPPVIDPPKLPPATKDKPAPAAPPSSERFSIRNQIEAWLKGVKIEARSAETFDYYKHKCKALMLHFEDLDGVDRVELGHLWAYIEVRRSQGKKTPTIKKELETLCQVAHSNGIDLRAKSPQIRRMFRKLDGKTKRQAKPLTWEEYQALRAELREDRQVAIDVAVFTGARKGELFELRIEDCDLKRGAVHIRGTKTRGSDRWVPLLPELGELVRAEMKLRRNGPLVAPWHCAWRDLGEACDRAGIARRSLVDLRHTFASWLVQAGCSSLSVGHLMGHTNSKMVDTTYGHFNLDSLRATIERMQRGRPPPDTPAPQT